MIKRPRCPACNSKLSDASLNLGRSRGTYRWWYCVDCNKRYRVQDFPVERVSSERAERKEPSGGA